MPTVDDAGLDRITFEDDDDFVVTELPPVEPALRQGAMTGPPQLLDDADAGASS